MALHTTHQAWFMFIAMLNHTREMLPGFKLPSDS